MIGRCAACVVKDDVIADLRRRLDEMSKTMLAAVDAKAYAIRHAADRPAPTPAPIVPIGPVTPEDFRRTIHQPAMSPEEIERSFLAEQSMGGV